MERWKSALAGVVKDGRLFSQILVILSVIGLFLSAACIDKRAVWQQYAGAFICTGILDVLVLAGWGWIFFSQLPEKEIF